MEKVTMVIEVTLNRKEPIVKGKWYIYSVIREGHTWKLYVDGELHKKIQQTISGKSENINLLISFGEPNAVIDIDAFSKTVHYPIFDYFEGK